MPGKKSTTTVPNAYHGREQAFIKHLLLKSYLEKLFMIVGMSARKLGITEFCYVDCFAGPWSDDSENIGGTSIAVSLQILDRCRQALEHRGVKLQFRALYVEKDPTTFARLEHYIADRTPAGIEAKALQGDFVSLREEILSWCGNGPFVFFFIDPTGWKEVSVNVLSRLLQRPRSEFLINFMYDFVNRTASMSEWKKEIAALLGETVIADDLPAAEREKLLLNTYRKNLKRETNTEGTWPARSAYVRVLDRKKERPKYHLVYVTSHPRGIIEFMEISQKLDYIQKRLRASTKQSARAEKSGMDDMFGNEPYVKPDDGHVSQSEVQQYWLNYLTGEAKRIGEEEFANLIEETDWFPGDFQRALLSLITAEKVRNLDAPKKRPKQPLHWKDGDRLQLMEKNK
jgi:three-Cys-motif partner protein